PKTWLDWTQADDPPCARVVGDPRPGTNDYEMAHTAIAPTQIYPLFETALRAEAGRTVDEHQREVSELWATFAAVSAANPHAWSRAPYSPEEIRTSSPDNRIVTFPYLKRMCANIDVDQSAALQDPGSIGMGSALGWYVTKPAIGLYSTTPPEQGFTRVDAASTQATVDALPGRQPAGAYSGPATVEATAVVFEREGAPAVAIMSTITRDGQRALANTRDTAVMQDMTEKVWEGRRVALGTDGTVNTLDA